jgi:c-di-GMP-binding flagellar brake protein YcgR
MSDELQSGPKGNEQPENLLALNLGIGDALQLQEPSAPNRRYYVKLIGFLNKAGIIVSHPMQDEKLLAIEDGLSFLVRGFSGRRAYEFNANVLFASHTPYPHLHLSFPKQIECLTMRGALRIQPKLASWIELMDAASAPIKVPAIMVDLSTSGARVHANRQFGKIGDEVKVAFRLPIDDEEQVFSISAVIRNSYNETLAEDLGGAEVMTHGLEFIQPVGVMRMALQNFIYKTMAEG